MKKVSFDFDSTLSRKDVQEYAKELVNRGIEVWICTSRVDTKTAINNGWDKDWNKDLYNIAEYVGIKNFIFTKYDDKYKYLTNDFIFHIDDDNIELSFFKSYSKVKPVYLFGNKNWKQDCENLLK